MKILNQLKIILFICALLFSELLYPQVQLCPIFSDNMVMQQQADVPMWGKATPQKKLKVVTSWDKKMYHTTVDAFGNWKVVVKTPAAGGSYEIEILGDRSVTLRNVLIGEVWICSGQSNMEMPLAGWGKIDNYEKEIEGATYPNIRLLQVEKSTNIVPVDDFTAMGGGWLTCTPQNIAEFSATAYFFGRSLSKLNVPIGLIHTSWGGTPAESWTSNESLMMMPEFLKEIEGIRKMPQDIEARKELIRETQKVRENEIIAKDFGYNNQIAVAAANNFDDGEWNTMSIPRYWEESQLSDFDGFVWFRKTIDIPSDWHGRKLILNMGTIDDNDVTYFNGEEVGRTEGFNVNRQYEIPSRLVKKGKAVIAVRVADGGGEGGIYGDRDNMYLSLVDTKQKSIILAGDWKYKVALSMKDLTPQPLYYSDTPYNLSSLYNAMIHPIVPYTIKGVIWYQGESNADKAYQYQTLFPLMINDWRTKWGYDFPFYYVQLANYKKTEEMPVESSWAELREAQLKALSLTHTGMAVTIDIGDANDIHPKNKQDVGGRLALIAKANLYSENNPYSGPIYQSYKQEGNKMRISFSHTDGGVKSKDGGVLKGFSVAGPDRKFYWADATIEGDEVVVSSPDVAFPIAVRYAWVDNPVCNLCNGAELPASPFRTDRWPGKTFDLK